MLHHGLATGRCFTDKPSDLTITVAVDDVLTQWATWSVSHFISNTLWEV